MALRDSIAHLGTFITNTRSGDEKPPQRAPGKEARKAAPAVLHPKSHQRKRSEEMTAGRKDYTPNAYADTDRKRGESGKKGNGVRTTKRKKNGLSKRDA